MAVAFLHGASSSSFPQKNHVPCFAAPCFRLAQHPSFLLSPPPYRRLHRRHASLSPLCKQQQTYPPSSPAPPPSTREEALEQARISIALFLDKALRTSGASPVRQRKLYKQPRLRVELPLLDESNWALASLLHDLLSPSAIGKRGTIPSSCVFCNSSLIEKLVSANDRSASAQIDAIGNPQIEYRDITRMVELQDVQLVVLLAPKLSEIAYIEDIVKAAGTKPVLLINPDWSPEEEEETSKAPFLQTFEVIYSYLPLIIQGFFSKTEGAVVKHVKGGAPAGRPWLIYVKDGDKMNCVSSLKKRPSAVDLENALYNAMAANSPVTKSVKFLRGLVGKS